MAALVLLFTTSCAGPEPAAAPPSAQPVPEQEEDPVFSAYIEHQAESCDAMAHATRCFEDSHWQYRIRDHAMRGDELRAFLRTLSRRFPEPGNGDDHYSRLRLLIRPSPDASYASLQRLIQLAAAEGIYRIECVKENPPDKARQQSNARPAAFRELRVALHWDSGGQRTKTQIESGFVDDREELQAAIDATFLAPGEGPPKLVVDAAALVPWRDIASVLAMAQGAEVLFATNLRFQ